MTVYKVWKPGQDEPEVVEAEDVFTADGQLLFTSRGNPIAVEGIGPQWSMRYVRTLLPHEWSRWSVVPDDAGRL